jgi:hypothetical protein
MDDEIEIAILPTVPSGLTYEDAMLHHWSPSFEPLSVLPCRHFAAMLAFLGITKTAYIEGVRQHYGVHLRSSARSTKRGDGPWTWTGEYAQRWRALTVPRPPRNATPILGIEALFEIMENASYGGVLAIAGFARPSLAARAGTLRGPIRISGQVQIGIIDFLWGSGHSQCLKQPLRLDLADGQVIEERQMAYSWDRSCGFVRRYYRFDDIEPSADLGRHRAILEPEAATAQDERVPQAA